MSYTLDSLLKRAREVLEVGSKGDTLSWLSKEVMSKRFKAVSASEGVREEILMIYVELCVDLRKAKLAKEGLMQLKNTLRSSGDLKPLERVIRHMLELSDQKAKNAQSRATQVLASIEDLDAVTPETLIVSSVSGEDAKDRTDREILTPWLKFLWETYRLVLEVLRNNLRTEELYHHTTAKAFEFCLQYKRAVEFRRLCDILRNHLTFFKRNVERQASEEGFKESASSAEYVESLSNAEMMHMRLESRFTQLDVASKLALWQEAFKSVEDIQSLLHMSRANLKPEVFEKYYTALAGVFWASEDFTFHAHAWYRLFSLSKTQTKNVRPEAFRNQASCVVLSALCLPLETKRAKVGSFESNVESEKNVRMASLLGFNLQGKSDTIASLAAPHMQDLAAHINTIATKLQHAVVPELKDVYRILAVDFHPLELTRKMRPILAYLKENEALSHYVEPLERAIVYRGLEQLSQVFKTMKLKVFYGVFDFMSPIELEKLIINASKSIGVPVRLDHRSGSIHFPQTAVERTKLQNQLTLLSKKLKQADSLINAKRIEEKRAERQAIFATIIKGLPKEHKDACTRQYIIENRNEEQHRKLVETERRREQRIRRLEKKRIAEETQRLEMENQRREQERLRREAMEQEQQQIEQIVAEFEKSTGEKIDLKGEFGHLQGEELRRAIQMKQQRVANEKRDEAEKKIQKMDQTLDYLERARREAEKPKIEIAYEQQRKEDKIAFEKQQEDAIVNHKLAYERDLQEKEHLAKFKDVTDAFVSKIMQVREKQAEELREEAKKRREAMIAQRIADLKQERRQEKERRRREERLRKRKLLEEERQRKAEEEKKRLAEERRARLEEERKEREEAARRQQEREREAEERARAREEERLKARKEPAAEPRGDRYEPPARSGDRYEPPRDNADRWKDRPQSDRPRTGKYEPPKGRWSDRDGERDGAGGFGASRGGYSRDGPRGEAGEPDKWRGGQADRRGDRDRDRGGYGPPRGGGYGPSRGGGGGYGPSRGGGGGYGREDRGEWRGRSAKDEPPRSSGNDEPPRRSGNDDGPRRPPTDDDGFTTVGRRGRH